MHPGTAAVMLYMVLCGKGTLFAMATVCILLHEAAHAVMAFILGEVPEEVEWLPLGALMRMEDEGRLSPLRRFAVLLAGPGMTLLLCSLSLALTRCGMLPKAIGRQLFIINAGFLLSSAHHAYPWHSCRVPMLCRKRDYGLAFRNMESILGSLWMLVDLCSMGGHGDKCPSANTAAACTENSAGTKGTFTCIVDSRCDNNTTAQDCHRTACTPLCAGASGRIRNAFAPRLLLGDRCYFRLSGNTGRKLPHFAEKREKGIQYGLTLKLVRAILC